MSTDQETQRLSADEERFLLDLARRTIEDELGMASSERVIPAVQTAALTARRGVFVTLKSSGELRGCIGSLQAEQPLVDNVRANARNAAFNDPRFAPLTRDEWPRVQIEISVLSVPRKLAYPSSEALPEYLTPLVDGVVIRKGYTSATFLPQVWKQLPRPQDFLAHLCLKAGLAADAWRREKLEVETYQVESFEEGAQTP
ncbi:MAG: AmmeMemoRadiSam system protein A [Desulfobacterales bacterium]|nr:AmmeMemoRadiSam system protein A [Desulfobacterales bacterium]